MSNNDNINDNVDNDEINQIPDDIDVDEFEEISEYIEHSVNVIEARSRRKPSNNKKRRAKSNNSKNVITNAKDYVEENKLKVLWTTFGILVIILIIALIVTLPKNASDNKNDNGNETSKEADSGTTDETSEEESPDINPIDLLEAEKEDSPVLELVENYYNAMFIQADLDEVAKYVDNMDNIKLDDTAKNIHKYIEEINNFTCFLLESSKENYYYLYVVLNYKPKGVEATCPDLNDFIVVKGDDGKYRIHNYVEGEQIYFASITDKDAITQLRSFIREQAEYALSNNEDLKIIYNILKPSNE